MSKEGPRPFGPDVRYTVRFTLMPEGKAVTCTVVTALGELKAAAVAGVHKARKYPDSAMGEIEIIKREDHFILDHERDFVDYWGSSV